MTVVAVVGASGAAELCAALSERLSAPTSGSLRIVEAPALGSNADWPARDVAMTLLIDAHATPQEAAQDRLLREALERLALPYAVIYGHGEQRTEAAMASLRPLLPRMPDDDPGPRFRPRCLECLDPACEQALHRKAQ